MSKLVAKVDVSVRLKSEDKVLEQHIKDFKKWLEEEKIDPESNLGRELTKQTRLLFEIERKTRHLSA